MPDTSPSVLIVRLDAIGDALALVPLLAALRAKGCPTGVVLSTVNAGIFARGAVAHTYVAAPQSLVREIEGDRYACALIATEDAQGYRLPRAARIPVRIGFENGWGKPLKTLWVRRLCTSTVHRTAGLDERAPHECAVLFELGRSLLGGAQPSRDPSVLRRFVLDADPLPDARVALQITDKWERLGRPLAEVTDLACRIARRTPVRAIAAAEEARYADAFEQAAGLPVERFADLSAWKVAIAAARALVAPDSGALHVAGMVGTPTVAAFAANPSFALQTARWYPWAAPHRIVKMEGAWPIVAGEALADLLSGTPPIVYRA